MPDPGRRGPAGDQAAGLRRLLAERPPQVIAFAAGRPGVGRTTLVVQTAATLARRGLRVIVVDEAEGGDSALRALGVRGAGDLFDAMIGKTPLQQLVREVEPQLWALPAAKAAALLRFETPQAVAAAAALIAPLQNAANYVLIDSLVQPGGQLSLMSARAHHMVVVVNQQAEPITQAYVLIKRLVQERGRDGFHLVVTRAGTEKAAHTIYENVQRTARQFLGVRIGFLGHAPVPATADLADALLNRLPLGQGGPAGAAGRRDENDSVV